MSSCIALITVLTAAISSSVSAIPAAASAMAATTSGSSTIITAAIPTNASPHVPGLNLKV